MLCLAEEPTSVEGYAELLKELEKLIEMSSGTVKEAMQAKHDFLELHYKDMVYSCAIEKLEAKQARGVRMAALANLVCTRNKLFQGLW